MKFLVDMNLSPAWCPVLQSAGFEATHWSTVSSFDAPDAELFRWAAANNCVVFANDLDVSSILAIAIATKTSVFQMRGLDLAPEKVGAQVVAVLTTLANELTAGALVTWDARRAHVSVLPSPGHA